MRQTKFLHKLFSGSGFTVGPNGFTIKDDEGELQYTTSQSHDKSNYPLNDLQYNHPLYFYFKVLNITNFDAAQLPEYKKGTYSNEFNAIVKLIEKYAESSQELEVSKVSELPNTITVFFNSLSDYINNIISLKKIETNYNNELKNLKLLLKNIDEYLYYWQYLPDVVNFNDTIEHLPIIFELICQSLNLKKIKGYSWHDTFIKYVNNNIICHPDNFKQFIDDKNQEFYSYGIKLYLDYYLSDNSEKDNIIKIATISINAAHKPIINLEECISPPPTPDQQTPSPPSYSPMSSTPTSGGDKLRLTKRQYNKLIKPIPLKFLLNNKR